MLSYLMCSQFFFLRVQGIVSVERILLPWKTGAIALEADAHYLSPVSFPFCVQIERKCFSIRELTMKKTVRPAVSKVSGDRGKSEAATTGGKPPAKSTTVAPLSKVKFIK